MTFELIKILLPIVSMNGLK